VTLYGLFVLAVGAFFTSPTPVPIPTGPGGAGPVATHDESALIAGLVIGIPSVIIAIASYWAATRANRATEQATKEKVDAEAYTRAQGQYSSHIADLRQQVEDLRLERDRFKSERDTALAELEEAHRELYRTQRRVTQKRHELDDLADQDPGLPGAPE
jgi:predicted RNase H-like nuclease (RuvC/YqgF family)